MLPDISIICCEAPAPPACPPDLQTLAAGYLDQLHSALARGEDAAVLTVYCWPQSPWPAAAGAYAVLRAAADFSYDHPQLRRLKIRCAGEECQRIYRFQWNMWFAERKEEAAETVTNL